MNEPLRAELLRLRDADLQLRDELAREGTLWDGYHPRMEAVHLANAVRLKEIVAEFGWPTTALVSDDGAEAAWLTVQHAISDPPFQREMLKVLQAAAQRGEIPAYQPAYLEDRICMYEGRPQIYGTQILPDENGLPTPWKIADPEHVNERRSALGLDTIEHRTEHFRSTSAPDQSPRDLQKYLHDYEVWLRRVGWRS